MREQLKVVRGEVYFADLSPVQGSEQGGTRPVLVLQNDVGNLYSPTTIVAAVTSRIHKAKLPTHVVLPAARYGLEKDSLVLLEQIRTIDKHRLKEKVCKLDLEYMEKVNDALEISLGLTVI
ncbi:MAG: type II toxin-antitoxin system PemK/MazF family toxin [Firmicutes bacterium]|nr:type II toxin-antitoxin system PemK/MazF family toxin [Bacillota bacterium]